jgi:hypothetical protein
MKTLLQIKQSLTILFATTILFACTKQVDTTTTPQNVKLDATSFVNAGLMHNTNLDLIFKEIKSKKINGMLKSLGNANFSDILSLQNRITNMETKIYQSSLTQTQQAALYIITNTAKSSLVYWNQNIDAWTGLVNETSLTSSPITHEPTNTFAIKTNNYGFSWKRVARSDVAGAVGGVAAWGVGALIGGPVTLTACGVSVGTWAAGCSAYEAIMQLW